MPAQKPAAISTILTVILLILLALLSIFVEMLAFNGASERQGLTAMGVSLGCQGIVLVLAGAFAGRMTRYLASKKNWVSAPAIIAAVLLWTMIGAVASFLSIIISAGVAGIK